MKKKQDDKFFDEYMQNRKKRVQWIEENIREILWWFNFHN